MKKIENAKIDIDLKDFPVEIVKLIAGLLDDKNFSIKCNARDTLVNMGSAIIPQMQKLLASKNVLLRKNAAKIVELVADRKSIPILINLLYDTESDIRWIAAEGLIKIGRRSISPLLKSIRSAKSSHLHDQGAHHVLTSLLDKDEKKNLASLLNSLIDYHELAETAPVEADKAIKAKVIYANSNS